MESSKKKVVVVAGTRPEAIKMAPVYMELKKSEKISPIFLSTAQHRQMLDQTLRIFGIMPDFDMNVMQPGQTLSDLTVRILSAWKGFFADNSIDAVLVRPVQRLFDRFGPGEADAETAVPLEFRFAEEPDLRIGFGENAVEVAETHAA